MVRLGHVLYGAAAAVALLLAAIVILGLATQDYRGDYFAPAFVGIVAAIIWLAGRSCCYVLAGR